MKLDLKLSGGELDLEREPMSNERFGTVCLLIGIGIGCWTLVAFFELFV